MEFITNFSSNPIVATVGLIVIVVTVLMIVKNLVAQAFGFLVTSVIIILILVKLGVISKDKVKDVKEEIEKKAKQNMEEVIKEGKKNNISKDLKKNLKDAVEKKLNK